MGLWNRCGVIFMCMMIAPTDEPFVTTSPRTRRWCGFVRDPRGLEVKNSQHKPSIEKFLTKRGEAFFDEVKKTTARTRQV